MPARATLVCDACGSFQLVDLGAVKHKKFKIPMINVDAPPGWQIAFLRANGKLNIVCVCSDSCCREYCQTRIDDSV